MYFIATCFDKPGSLQLRMDSRPAHLEHLKANLDAIRVAGPLMKEDGETPCGSMLIIEVANRAAAQTILDADPYTKAGLFASMTLLPWKWTLGAPEA